MMAIEAVRLCSVETTELLELGRHDEVERSNEPWVKQDVGEAVPQQVSGQLSLPFHE